VLAVSALLACDNCTNASSSSAENWIVIALIVGILLVAVLMWVAGGIYVAPMRIAARWLLGAFVIGLVVSPWFMVRETSLQPPGGGGLECGSALHASLEHGIPTDAALDGSQIACKEAGQASIRRGVRSYAISAAILILALVIILIGWIARLSANHAAARMDPTELRLSGG